jgi:hypothetical protein
MLASTGVEHRGIIYPAAKGQYRGLGEREPGAARSVSSQGPGGTGGLLFNAMSSSGARVAVWRIIKSAFEWLHYATSTALLVADMSRL